jgi:2-iminobutanoate/2-iminopropanoate deaminase
MTKRQVLEVPGVSHDAPIPMGVRMGNLVVSSGIAGKDPETGRLPPDPSRQVELMFQHVRTLMAAAGGSPADIARMTVYVKDIAYREQVNGEWLQMFPDEDDRPSRHTLQWDLRGGMLVQCEILALLDQ